MHLRPLAALLLVLPLACQRPAPSPAPPAPPAPAPPPAVAVTPAAPADHDAGLAKGVAFLLAQQSADGAWRSDVYGTFKDGPALTPLAVVALQEASSVPHTVMARRKGSEFLAKLVKPDGTSDADLDYPVYTAALSAVALSHPDNRDLLPARDGWVKFLLARQLAEPLGWAPSDKEYGGWGYCRTLPRKPEPGKLAPPLVESNLSATVFALEALRTTGVTEKAVYERAARFIARCHNHVLMGTAESFSSAVDPLDDGGFHFIDADPVRNKAGAATSISGAQRFHSYGSATADGFRALIHCDHPGDEFQLPGARRWLTTHFRPDTHPGVYVAAHEGNREAVYFYYAASVAKALRAANVAEAGGGPWAPALAGALLARQKADGSWANPVELVRENDPVVATCNAVSALASCRAAAAK